MSPLYPGAAAGEKLIGWLPSLSIPPFPCAQVHKANQAMITGPILHSQLGSSAAGALALVPHKPLLELRGGFSFDGEVVTDLLVSVCVLVAVAVAARSGSSIMSAVFSTAPTGVPLSLWLVHRAACTVEGGGKAATVSIDRFLIAVIKGGLALAAFALGALTLLRTLGDAAPPPLAALLSAGFGAWAAAWGLLRHV